MAHKTKQEDIDSIQNSLEVKAGVPVMPYLNKLTRDELFHLFIRISCCKERVRGEEE